MKYMLLFFILSLSESINCYSQELPIKPSRTITFTTDEGSYMNVDVSPNGKTLLFDLLGDLYSVPANGGNPKQLTRGIAPTSDQFGHRMERRSLLSAIF